MVTMLVTRPQPDASETAARLFALDIDALVEPLLSAETLASTLPPADGFAALAATSANALRALHDRGELPRVALGFCRRVEHGEVASDGCCLIAERFEAERLCEWRSKVAADGGGSGGRASRAGCNGERRQREHGALHFVPAFFVTAFGAVAGTARTLLCMRRSTFERNARHAPYFSGAMRC